MPHHGQHRHRHVPRRRHRRPHADEKRRHGDVSRQGGRQEQFPLLRQGSEDAVDRAPDARNLSAPCPRTRRVLAALSAEGGSGHRADHRGRGAVALDSSRTRRSAAGPVHSARRGDRPDRSDRALGAQGGLRAKHGLAAPRIAAGIDGGQPVAASVHRREPAAGHRRGAGRERHVAGACCSSRSPKA